MPVRVPVSVVEVTCLVACRLRQLAFTWRKQVEPHQLEMLHSGPPFWAILDSATWNDNPRPSAVVVYFRTASLGRDLVSFIHGMDNLDTSPVFLWRNRAVHLATFIFVSDPLDAEPITLRPNNTLVSSLFLGHWQQAWLEFDEFDEFDARRKLSSFCHR